MLKYTKNCVCGWSASWTQRKELAALSQNPELDLRSCFITKGKGGEKRKESTAPVTEWNITENLK